MKFDAQIAPDSLSQVAGITAAAEEIGFDALWSSETQHDPFLPLALVAEHSQRMQFGTAVAIGFARSPTTLAHTAWDLAAASSGRFILGLGTQVRAHIERRFGMSWPESPVEKLRELIAAIRGLWHSWQTGERLNLRGQYFKLTLMTPFFDPGPIDDPTIPIYIAGVNTGLARLAGEAADGFHAHPYHSARYLREIVRPAIDKGCQRAGRDPSAVSLSTAAFAVTGESEAGAVRAQIAFYASTPTYRPVMELHGWGETADRLQAMARRGEWDQMGGEISEPMLQTFAVVCEPDQLGTALAERYVGLVDRLALYLPYAPQADGPDWAELVSQVRAYQAAA